MFYFVCACMDMAFISCTIPACWKCRRSEVTGYTRTVSRSCNRTVNTVHALDAPVPGAFLAPGVLGAATAQKHLGRRKCAAEVRFATHRIMMTSQSLYQIHALEYSFQVLGEPGGYPAELFVVVVVVFFLFAKTILKQTKQFRLKRLDESTDCCWLCRYRLRSSFSLFSSLFFLFWLYRCLRRRSSRDELHDSYDEDPQIESASVLFVSFSVEEDEVYLPRGKRTA